MTIKNAALISLIGVCVDGFVWLCQIIYNLSQWGPTGWTFVNFLNLILLNGSLIIFLSVVYYNHHKKEKMNQSQI